MQNGTTALHLAAEKGQLESVRVLLQYDANPYCPDIVRRAPVYLRMPLAD